MGSDYPPREEPEDGSARNGDEPQRFGPLELRRFTKEDGRRLILYAWAGGNHEEQE
jgi:hypothetical protein